MDLETTQKITDLQRRLDTQELPERPTDLISSFLALPGLRGFWSMSAFGGAVGATFDQSGNGRTLTYNGNPTYNYDGLVPYIDLDGTGDFLSRADEGGFDITGIETYVAAAVRGLTFGGWFYPTVAALSQMIGKADNFNGSYSLINEGTGDILFRIRDNTDTFNFDVRTSLTLNVWQFVVGRYDPSTEIKVRRNATTNTNTVGIPASLLNGADNFAIGALSTGASPFTGRASLCFLCAAMLSDTIIDATFQATRAAFGV